MMSGIQLSSLPGYSEKNKVWPTYLGHYLPSEQLAVQRKITWEQNS